jgi:hypothetical protein
MMIILYDSIIGNSITYLDKDPFTITFDIIEYPWKYLDNEIIIKIDKMLFKDLLSFVNIFLLIVHK